MPSFAHRSLQKELLDRDDIPFADIRQNMLELDTINQRLGGHAVTIAGIKKVLGNNQPPRLHIAEIGCGGGDNLRVVREWCRVNRINASFTGVDINPHCIAFAASRPENSGISFLASDYRIASFAEKPNIIFSSLFCHHFSDDDLVTMFEWMKLGSSTGFFVNDLHRHPLAYHSIRMLTRMFSKSYLVKNDAPLSVLRGFSSTELQAILHEAKLQEADIDWKWAFRWLVTYRHNDAGKHV